MRKYLHYTFLAIVCAFLSFGGAGCHYLGNYTVTKRDTIDKAIATARADTEAKMAALKEQETKTLKDTIVAHTTREQSASDYLFKGSLVFGGLKQDSISRPTLIMGQSIQQTAAQLPPATAAAQAVAFKALQTELDETKVSAEVLRAQYDKELGVARAEGEAKAKALADLDGKLKAVELEKTTVLGKALTTEQTLQAAKDKIQDKDLADKTREAENAKSVQAIKLKMSSIVGVLALLCIAGAIWSPVYKEKFGIGAVVFAVAAAAIWYVEGWMVAVAIGVAILGLVAWAAKNHYIESKAATNVYRAVESFKNTSKDEYDKLLRPHLEEWMTQYTKSGEKVVDQAAIDHVDSVLIKVGDK